MTFSSILTLKHLTILKMFERDKRDSLFCWSFDDEGEKIYNIDLRSDDFFPYASDPHAYWTGYFTSRWVGEAGNPYWREMVGTVYLLELASLDQLIFILKNIIYFFSKVGTLMRRSTVVRLSLQLVFSVWIHKSSLSVSVPWRKGQIEFTNYQD